MAKERVQRRLAAILVADVVGYSRLMGEDEESTLETLKTYRRDLIDPKLAAYSGRIVKLMGDGMLAEFPSVVDALACAIDVQESVAKRNIGIPDDRRIVFRVGINVGDVIVEEDDLYGDGVNIAARLEHLAEPGCICVSGAVREQVEGKLDARLADGGPQQIKGIVRPVHIFRWSPVAEAAAALTAVAGSEAAATEKPSIAVLPFDYLSDDPEQAHLADGLIEDVITLLSQVRWLFVIARNSTFTYKGRAVDVQQVAQELGVRYVLEGSVRTAGQRIRVSAQLIDGPSRAHLWAQRYDRELKDIFALQDEITEAIVGALEPELGAAERERARRNLPDNLDAWSCYQRGLWHFYRFRPADTLEALQLFERAIALDPNFGPAYAGKSCCHFSQEFLGYAERSTDAIEEAHRAAQQGVALDERDAFSRWALGRALFLRREPDLAIAELETAIDISPSFAQAHYGLGWVLAFVGRYEQALSCLDKACRLSPHDPLLFGFMSARGMTLILMGQYDEAVKWNKMAVRQPNAHFQNHAILASSLGLFGRIDEAKRALDETIRLRPDFCSALVERTIPFQRPEDLEHFLEGLRKAGIPE